MQKRIWLGALVVVAAVLWLGSAAWAQDFYVVPGGGAPVGTKITSLPAAGLTISNPGFYFLAGNLSYMSSSGNAITIAADNVTLDLMGFSLTAPGTLAVGIYMSGRNNVEVRNGTLRGFSDGVFEASASGGQHRIINVRAYGNYNGIILSGNNNLVKDCSASGNSFGIVVGSGLIVDCVADSNGSLGIQLNGPGDVLGNTASNNGTYNFYLGTGSATSILVDRNSSFGKANNYNYGSSTGVVFGTNSSDVGP